MKQDEHSYPALIRRFVALMQGAAVEHSEHSAAIEKLAECLTPLEQRTVAIICAAQGADVKTLRQILENMDVVIAFRVLRDSFIATGERQERERQLRSAVSPPPLSGREYQT